MKRILAAARAGLVGSVAFWMGCSTVPTGEESEAYRVLRRMSETLAAARSFSFEVTTAADQVADNGGTVRVSRQSRIVVARPDRIFASVAGDDGARALWHKGPSLTLLERNLNEYATAKVPAKIDAMLDYAMDEHGLSIPMADLLFSDPYAVLTAEVKNAVYMGIDTVGGVEADHLLFIQDNVDWEIWIDAGAVPLVRKVVITRKLEPGSPQFVAMIGSWDLSAAPAADAFDFQPPEGARQVSMREWFGIE